MNQIYSIITETIIQKLEQGVVPWHKTWKSEFPRNFVNDKCYKGVNVLLLGMQDYESHYWLSFKQCQNLGGSIKKDEKSTLVVFWNQNYQIVPNTLETELYFILRYYRVFNIDQCILPDKVLEKKSIVSDKPISYHAKEVIDNYKAPPIISTNNIIPNPRYFPRIDKIEIQSINNFNSQDDYYSSLFHECIHSTGHSKRLNRTGISEKIEFASDNYCKEELIAEIGSCFLCNYTNIEKTIDNQTSYIDNWLKALKSDKRLIIFAASAAQKAVDYILNLSVTNNEVNQ